MKNVISSSPPRGTLPGAIAEHFGVDI